MYMHLTDCIGGYCMDSGTCIKCPVDQYKAGVDQATSCATCAVGYHTGGQTGQTACTGIKSLL